MNVSLSSELERFVRKSVASGRYSSASEVVREALRLLEEVDQARKMRQESVDAKLRELQLEVMGSLFEKDLKPQGAGPKKHQARLSRS